MAAYDDLKVRAPSGWMLAAAYIAVVLVPAVAALRHADPGAGVSLVVGSGVAAVAMLLAQFVTSGRFEQVSGRIGLDVTMGFHRIAGIAVVAMILAHVLALPFRAPLPNAGRYLPRLENALTAPGNLTGVLALVLLLFLVPWAKWLRGMGLPYETWRVLHGAGAVAAILLVGLHVAARGDAVFAPVAVWVLSLAALTALCSLAIVYVLRPRSAYGRGFVVESVEPRTPSIVELEVMAPSPGTFSFRPGQFAWIAFAGRHTATDHPFSIASSPTELPRMRFLIREAGDGTRAIASLRPGTSVAVDGPHGTFVERGDPDAIVMIAGGIGIAPVLSLLRFAAERGDTRPHRVLYAARRAEELVAAEEIAGLRQRLDLRLALMVEDGDLPDGAARGRFSAAAAQSLVSDLDRGRVLAFVCGPPPMMDSAVSLLIACGLESSCIVTERFDYDAAHDPVSRAMRRRFLGLFAVVAAALVVGSLA